MTTNTDRYAIIGSSDPHTVAAYLPANYRVLATVDAGTPDAGIIIGGHDDSGWTLDGYVLPRLASGLHWGRELPATEAMDLADDGDPFEG